MGCSTGWQEKLRRRAPLTIGRNQLQTRFYETEFSFLILFSGTSDSMLTLLSTLVSLMTMVQFLCRKINELIIEMIEIKIDIKNVIKFPFSWICDSDEVKSFLWATENMQMKAPKETLVTKQTTSCSLVTDSPFTTVTAEKPISLKYFNTSVEIFIVVERNIFEKVKSSSNWDKTPLKSIEQTSRYWMMTKIYQ